jgi:hypothetical protein
MGKNSSLHGLGLHEYMNPSEGVIVLRVPGGWVYTVKVNVIYHVEPEFNTVFVPYNEDFDERE